MEITNCLLCENMLFILFKLLHAGKCFVLRTRGKQHCLVNRWCVPFSGAC